ncbi:hypothetical protein J3R30DRAFT_232980 [Lentinula aciculospora]|uniref:Uncharacterized protein n=1 Tax=Lentinula aciculospora TaxID=153920 RepID=A0A9W9AA74_9AGAR|nr:hypothetical protein J3R30DRAFT_232980 [Lentinula aciculospora]
MVPFSLFSFEGVPGPPISIDETFRQIRTKSKKQSFDSNLKEIPTSIRLILGIGCPLNAISQSLSRLTKPRYPFLRRDKLFRLRPKTKICLFFPILSERLMASTKTFKTRPMPATTQVQLYLELYVLFFLSTSCGRLSILDWTSLGSPRGTRSSSSPGLLNLRACPENLEPEVGIVNRFGTGARSTESSTLAQGEMTKLLKCLSNEVKSLILQYMLIPDSNPFQAS